MAICEPAYRPQLGLGHRQEIPPVEQGLPGDLGPPGETHDGLGGDALPGSRFADDAQGLAAVHRKGHPPDGLHHTISGWNDTCKILYLEQCHLVPSLVSDVPGAVDGEQGDDRRRLPAEPIHCNLGTTVPLLS